MLSEPKRRRASEPPEDGGLVLLGFREDGGLVEELARLLHGFRPRLVWIERGFDRGALVGSLAAAKLVLIGVTRPESTPSELPRLIDLLLAELASAVVRVLTPSGTYNGILLGLGARSLVIDLGRKLDPRALEHKVASQLVAAAPIDLPTSLYRSAVAQRSLELLSENLSLAASWTFRDWQLAYPDDGGRRPNPLWSSWLTQTRKLELERLAKLLDELRIEDLLERSSAAASTLPAPAVPTSTSFSKATKARTKE